MGHSRAEVLDTVHAFLTRANKPAEGLTDETPLYADGVGLDSLETAELSATLEDTFGDDPFQSADMPRTVGDIVAFYVGAADGAVGVGAADGAGAVGAGASADA